MTSQAPAALIGILDDDDAVREAIANLFKASGFQTAVFASTDAFLHSARRHETRCLIVDMQMPGLRSLELLRQLTDMRVTTGVVFVSARADEVRSQALAQGAVAVLRKPFTDDAMLDAVMAAFVFSARQRHPPNSDPRN